MVKEYFNRYVVSEEKGIKKISCWSVNLLDYRRIDGRMRVQLNIPKYNQNYEVFYDKKTGRIDSSILEKGDTYISDNTNSRDKLSVSLQCY